ncbi:hypothetical protein ACFLU4_07400 [Chloroflexota bacterium]
MVLEGFRREVTVNELCRREGIKPGAYHKIPGWNLLTLLRGAILHLVAPPTLDLVFALTPFYCSWSHQPSCSIY